MENLRSLLNDIFVSHTRDTKGAERVRGTFSFGTNLASFFSQGRLLQAKRMCMEKKTLFFF